MQYYKSPEGSLIKQLLNGVGFTHPTKTVVELSAAQARQKPAGSPHSVADILAHMNFWQAWTLAAVAGEPRSLPAKAALGWPSVSEVEWTGLVTEFAEGLERAVSYTKDAELLSRPLSPDKVIGFGFEKNTVGSALTEIIAFHNAHHAGQIILLRRTLGVWPPEGGGMTW